jgi:dTDP-4-amino-4,6-dideoxygalactose transaminase
LATVEGLVAPFEPQWSRAVYHLYVVRVQDRQEMQNILKGAGVATGIHYPVPLHVQQAYRALGYSNGDLPITERVSAEILSLPMYPQLNQERQAKVIKQIKECLMVPSSASR